MSEDLVQGVIETIDSANQHRLHLAELLNNLDEATKQVKSSNVILPFSLFLSRCLWISVVTDKIFHFAHIFCRLKKAP